MGGEAKLKEERDGGREEDGEMMIAVRWAAARWRVKASATTPWRFGSTAAGEAASTSFGNKEEEDQEDEYEEDEEKEEDEEEEKADEE